MFGRGELLYIKEVQPKALFHYDLKYKTIHPPLPPTFSRMFPVRQRYKCPNLNSIIN